MSSSAGKEFALASPPPDGVSSVAFSPVEPSLLLATSWDGQLRLYDTAANSLRGSSSVTQPQGASPGAAPPLLDGCFSPDGSRLFAGGLGRTVRAFDAANLGDAAAAATLGAHDDAVKCVEFAGAHNLLVTGSWDRTVKLWDPRAPSSSSGVAAAAAGSFVASIAVTDRVYSMALAGPDTLVVATAGRHILHVDLRKHAVALARESSLKHQTRVLRAFTDGSGYASGSIEGRVAIEFVDQGPGVQAGKYAFKCHRAKSESGETVHPVHAMAFHPVHGTFATGGGDGHVSIWDWVARKRLHQSSNYGTTISSLAFNKDGTQLAVAASYTFDGGDAPHPADAIVIRSVADSDVRPKAAAAAGQQAKETGQNGSR